jgi:hypothetical protein
MKYPGTIPKHLNMFFFFFFFFFGEGQILTKESKTIHSVVGMKRIWNHEVMDMERIHIIFQKITKIRCYRAGIPLLYFPINIGFLEASKIKQKLKSYKRLVSQMETRNWWHKISAVAFVSRNPQKTCFVPRSPESLDSPSSWFHQSESWMDA